MKKKVFLWALYDFANSIVSIAFFLYFSQWYVVEQKIADIWFNLLFTGSAVLLLCTVPFIGRALDRGMAKLPGLRITTACTFFLYALTALCGIYFPHLHVVISLFFLFALYSYLLSFTFYTPILRDLSRDANIGKISGIGICANYFGQIAAVLICLPFANGMINLFGSSPRLETLLPASALFFLCALPMLIFFKEEKSVLDGSSATKGGVVRDFVSLCTANGLGFFFLSYFLFNDGILTAANNFPIYLEQVFTVSDAVKSMVLLSILVGSAIGGLVFGRLADKHGHKKILLIILWVMLAIFILFSVANLLFFFVGAALMGFAFGGLWAVSRSIVPHLSPKSKINSAFAYVGLVERISSFAGPLVWGGIATSLVSIGPDRYRIATIAMAVFIFLGILALKRVGNEREVVTTETI